MKIFHSVGLMYCALVLAYCNAHTDIQKIEKKHDLKIGIYAIDTNNDNTFSYRENEYFPFQSTVKLMISASALKNIKADEEICFSSDDVVFWSPIIRLNLDKGCMTVEQLVEAAMSYSDSTAANLLMQRLGGIRVVNKFAKLTGNKSFYLNNMEPNLNSNSHNKRDASTPKDMAQSIQKILLTNDVLRQKDRQKLKNWMMNSTTGYRKIRSGLPPGWHAAEKTGGSANVANDIGIVWSPSCKPIVLAIYTVSNEKINIKNVDVISTLTKMILDYFSKNNACFNLTHFR